MSEQRFIVTPGEPAGIGPDLVSMLAKNEQGSAWAAVTDPDLIAGRATTLGIDLNINLTTVDQTWSTQPDTINIIPHKLAQPCIAGELNPANAAYVIETLKTSIQYCMDNKSSGMITGPVHKGVINDAGISFTGHTELLAELTNTDDVVMMLACPELRVALATTHLPLKDVAAAITKEKLAQTFRIVLDDLEHKFGIKKPRILVSGLNPHAGENGHLGTEELDTIIPVIESFQHAGHHIEGPFPADTLFSAENIQYTDAFICMYHDQGLPVLKYLGFGRAINITLGLPIIRTSVDHGTALNLAGTGNVDIGSFISAFLMAEHMAAMSSK